MHLSRDINSTLLLNKFLSTLKKDLKVDSVESKFVMKTDITDVVSIGLWIILTPIHKTLVTLYERTQTSIQRSVNATILIAAKPKFLKVWSNM